MKKRLKMILTSAMLAFSLSMLSLGVLAATQHILGINNFIIFDILDNIACDIEAVSGISTSPDVNFSTAYSAIGNKTIKLTGDIENGFSKTDGNIILNSSGECEPWTNASPAELNFTNDTVYWLFKITNKTENAIVVSVLDTEGNALSNLNGKMNLINTYGKNADTVPDSNESFEVTQNDIIYVLIALEMQQKKANFRQDWSFVVHIENPATAAILLMSWKNKIRYNKK